MSGKVLIEEKDWLRTVMMLSGLSLGFWDTWEQRFHEIFADIESGELSHGTIGGSLYS